MNETDPVSLTLTAKDWKCVRAVLCHTPAVKSWECVRSLQRQLDEIVAEMDAKEKP
jgi:hypothetical protein